MVLTDFPETTTRDDKGVIQGNQGALTSNAITKGGIVGVPDELGPITVDDGRPSLDKWVFDAVEEGGVGFETGEGNSFQLESLAGKVRIDELLDIAVRGVGSVDSGEIREDIAGRFVCRFVDESLLVRVQIRDVDGLKELSWIRHTVSARRSCGSRDGE